MIGTALPAARAGGVRRANDQAVGGRQRAHHRAVLDLERHGLDDAVGGAHQARAQIVLAPVVLFDGNPEPRGCRRLGPVGKAAQPVERRLQEEEGAYQGRDRVAGEPDHRRAAVATDHQGLARAHRDFPEIDVEPVFGEDAAHEVVLADRDAAGADQEVDPACGGGKAAQRVGVVGRVADEDRHAAAGGDEGGERQRVRADDLVRADRVARHDDLVAGREDPDARPAMHEKPRPVHRRGEPDVAGREAPSGMQQHIALGEIEPGAADITAARRALAHFHPVAGACGVLLDDDRVGPVGQRRPGKDARRFARPQRAAKPGAGRDLGDDAQAHRDVAEIVRAHGIAVHRRDREGRLGPPRAEILREDPADPLGD